MKVNKTIRWETVKKHCIREVRTWDMNIHIPLGLAIIGESVYSTPTETYRDRFEELVKEVSQAIERWDCRNWKALCSRFASMEALTRTHFMTQDQNGVWVLIKH